MAIETRETRKRDAAVIDGGERRSSIVHDLNGLIGVILLATRELESGPSSEQSAALGREIAFAANRAASLTRELAGSTQRPTAGATEIELGALLVEIGPSLERLGEGRVSIALPRAKTAPRIRGEREWIERAIFNLVKNAVESVRGTGAIEIDLERRSFDASSPRGAAGLYSEVVPPPESGEYMVLSVLDDGRGMQIDPPRRALGPRFSTKRTAGDEHGLGLSIVRHAAERARGGLILNSIPGVGTLFELFLPLARQER